jgi:hypothetical protein
MPLDDDHLPAGLTRFADLPLENDEGVVRHPQNPELAVIDRRDQCAFVLLGAYLRLHGGPVV